MTLNIYKTSHYINEAFYYQLIQGLQDWERDVNRADSETRREVEALLFREARLLDEGKFEEWLDMFTSECLYWVPSVPGGGNPRQEVSIAFDDRRRLEDRVSRLRTGFAWSQIPASRTIRMLSNLEVWLDKKNNQARARTCFMLSEFRAGRQKTYSGWYGHRLVKEDGKWKISIKQINLLDCDQGHENMTFIL